jgi:hypothetical protein
MTDPSSDSSLVVTPDGTFGNPSGASGQVDDYEYKRWDWIEAAIVGGAALLPGADSQHEVVAVASPASMFQAAQVFYQVQVTLDMAAKSISDQANALAGKNGAWKGPSADSFYALMQTFSNDIRTVALQIAGGSAAAAKAPAGQESAQSVPQQLWSNAETLAWAQNTIQAIDSYYAQQAIALGHQWPNGLAHVGDLPLFVEAMTNQMRTVARNLAQNYQLTIDSVTPPTPVAPPTDSAAPPPSEPLPDDAPPVSVPTDPTPLPSGFTNGPSVPPPTLNGPPPDLDLNSSVPSPLLGSPGSGADANFAGDQSLADTGPTGLPDAPSGVGGLSSDLGGVPALLPPPDDVTGAGGFDEPVPLPAATGGAAAADDVPAPFPGSLSGPSGSGDVEGISPATAPAAFSGALNAPSGLGSAASFKSPDLAAAPLPGVGNPPPAESLSGAEPGSPQMGGSLDAGVQQGLGGAGLPMMPGGLGGVPGQAGGERSDASGLLGGVSVPWGGAVAGVGDPGAVGVGAGRQAEWAGDVVPVGQSEPLPTEGVAPADNPGAAGGLGGAGLPMMPGGLGGVPGQAGGERSDASGLLGGVSVPWDGAVAGVGDPGAVGVGAGPPTEWASSTGVSNPVSTVPPDDADGWQAVDPNAAVDVTAASYAASSAVVGAGWAEPELVRVPVVRASDSPEDTEAWDVTELPLLAALLPVRRILGRRDTAVPDLAAGLPVTTVDGSENVSHASYRRRRQPAGSGPAAGSAVPMCGAGGDSTEWGTDSSSDQDAGDTGAETEDEEPATAADLLTERWWAWRPGSAGSSGVLE